MPQEYTVKQGDCISSIAGKHGHFWEKIWNHPNNAELKESREDPNILHPGDVVFIPDKEEKQEDCATEQRHRFKKKGVPAKLRLRILKEKDEEENEEESEDTQASASEDSDDDSFVGEEPERETTPPEEEPRKNVPYVLEIDGQAHSGQTDDDGRIEVSLPETARKGKLILNPGTEEEEVIQLNLGNVNPVTQVSGVKQRLANLMLYNGDIDEEETADLEPALRTFQQMHDLEETGQIDQATKDKLVDVHGC